jgi:uncharacterized protein
LRCDRYSENESEILPKNAGYDWMVGILPRNSATSHGVEIPYTFHQHFTGLMRFFIFFGVWSVILGLAFFYVGRRVIRPLTHHKRTRRYLWLLIGILWLVPLSSFHFFLTKQESATGDSVTWAGYIILGILSLVINFAVVRDLVLGMGKLGAAVRRRLPGKRPTSVASSREVNLDRRAFLMRSTNLAILTGAGAGSLIGFHEARHRAEIRKITIPLANLPAAFDGFRIAQFSDLHIGPTIKRSYVERVVRQVNELGADCVVFTGDLVDGSVGWLREDAAPLADVSAPSGKFFVTGNHEYYSGAEAWIEEAERLGFQVLLNRHEIFTRGDTRIALAGVTDYSGGQFVPHHVSRPAETAAAIPPGIVKILLAHQPVTAHAASRAGFDLQLSGHTHGGQFFPWNYVAYLNQPFIKGLHKMGNMWVYVNSGIGYWGPPLRLGAPPEITHITLVRTAGAAQS